MKKPDYDNSQQFWVVFSAIVVFFAVLHLLGGCATAGSVKKKIAADLEFAIKAQDCPMLCDYLRTYIETKLK